MAAGEEDAETSPSYYGVVGLMLCESKGDTSELLRAYPNFDPDAVPADTDGLSYLHCACAWRHFYVVRGLLQCGASLLRKDADEYTPLQYACDGEAEERVAFVEWFLSEHADARTTIDWADTIGNTALHRVALWGGSKLIRILLAHGANPTCENNRGETAAQRARCHGETSTASMLEAAERAHLVLAIGEWRPWKQEHFSLQYRIAMHTLVILARACDQVANKV
jgi:ankyrin repeat protein